MRATISTQHTTGCRSHTHSIEICDRTAARRSPFDVRSRSMHLIDLPATCLENYTLGRRKSCNEISGRERYQLLAAARAVCMIRTRPGIDFVLALPFRGERETQVAVTTHALYSSAWAFDFCNQSLTHPVQSERAICAHCARSGHVTLTHRHLDLAQTRGRCNKTTPRAWVRMHNTTDDMCSNALWARKVPVKNTNSCKSGQKLFHSDWKWMLLLATWLQGSAKIFYWIKLNWFFIEHNVKSSLLFIGSEGTRICCILFLAFSIKFKRELR